jgi:DNA-binding transcriptional MocR family regulator
MSSRSNALSKPATRQQAGSALQYGATEGYEPLRELIANNMARYGIKAKAENVLITSGSQQALDLIGKLFSARPREPAPRRWLFHLATSFT